MVIWSNWRTRPSSTRVLCVSDQRTDQSRLRGLSRKQGILSGFHRVALRLRSEMDPCQRDLTNILLSYLVSDSFGPMLGARAWSCKTTDDYLGLSQLWNTSETFGERCLRLPPRLLIFYIVFLLYGSMGLTILDHIYSSFL